METNRNFSGRHNERSDNGRQMLNVSHLCEKYDVGRNIVMDAFERCGNNPAKVEEYLSERTGRGRGSLGGDPGMGAPK